MTFAEQLESIDACGDAVRWVGNKTLEQAWQSCERADWMLWYCAKVLPRPRTVLAACACARTALQYVSAGEMRPLRAIEAAEAWAHGDATIEDVKAASAAAYASYASYAYSASYASYAYSAAYASYASDASYASYASDAAYASAAAAYASDDASAVRKKSLRDMADIVRGIITLEELIAAQREVA